MALKINTTFKGIPVMEAYCTVDMLSISTGKNLMGFHVLYRSSAEDAVFDTKVFSAPYSLDAGNPFEQAYAYLKISGEPEFANCKDC
ncbi:hypothetical protein QN377_05090 [Pseudomonas sp. CCC4.1]|uniref:hypothetical protein n=1 Tax=Pseudomonas sp. CCC4.1 TaxID=3048610 RepID=UPI002AB4CA52|nr:hypothetical protein [Pseudomonas sp. CCC4.1]MDY7569416.1 hypothetical protein [Pseudomonas sp. CCC4.1]MEB0142500.1 hypothetical protein [Pseudomonas sp. CCC4.1]